MTNTIVEEAFVYPKNTWEAVMNLKNAETRVVKGCCNSLTEEEFVCIWGTLDWFNATKRLIQDTRYMLMGFGKFRVFDWLATEISSLKRGVEEVPNIPALKVLSYSFLKCKGDIDLWIQDLRETDYAWDNSWMKIKLGDEM